jgi:hypothetical protein
MAGIWTRVYIISRVKTLVQVKKIMTIEKALEVILRADEKEISFMQDQNVKTEIKKIRERCEEESLEVKS